LSSFRADCTTFISAELASEQGGLGQQCGIDLLLAKILSKGNKKRKKEREISFFIKEELF